MQSLARVATSLIYISQATKASGGSAREIRTYGTFETRWGGEPVVGYTRQQSQGWASDPSNRPSRRAASRRSMRSICAAPDCLSHIPGAWEKQVPDKGRPSNRIRTFSRCERIANRPVVPRIYVPFRLQSEDESHWSWVVHMHDMCCVSLKSQIPCSVEGPILVATSGIFKDHCGCVASYESNDLACPNRGGRLTQEDAYLGEKRDAGAA